MLKSLLLSLFIATQVHALPSIAARGFFSQSQADTFVATCTSCTVTTSGNYKIYDFKVDDTLIVTANPSGFTGEYEGCGAGGGGGQDIGGGGGGGGYRTASGYALPVGSYTVDIGTGGTGGVASSNATPGGGTSTTWDSANIVFEPGRMGAYYNGASWTAGGSATGVGNSGGGSIGGTTPGTVVSGYSGGTGGPNSGGTSGAAGGGGCSGAGGDGANSDPGDGGPGLTSTLLVTPEGLCGGGGGAGHTYASPRSTATHGGGAGNNTTNAVAGSSATANSCGGGGGGGFGFNGGSGADGRFILKVQRR